MSSLVSPLLSFLLLYKYWALFVVTLSASIILPLPTNSLLLAAGAFASQGYFSFLLSLFVAVGANLLGDLFDYFLARRYGHRALKMLRIRTPSYMERLERYVRDHPGPTIFLTRFVGTIEPLTSLLAGFIGVPLGLFIFYDVLGNLVSDGGIMCIGYLLGANWQSVLKFLSITNWVLAGILIVAAVAAALWYRNRRSRAIDPR